MHTMWHIMMICTLIYENARALPSNLAHGACEDLGRGFICIYTGPYVPCMAHGIGAMSIQIDSELLVLLYPPDCSSS